MKLLKISALALFMSFAFSSCSDMNMEDMLKKKKPDHTEQPTDNNGGGHDDGGHNDGGNSGGGNNDY